MSLVNNCPPDLGSKIGFVGDSFSSGYGLVNPATERWTKLFTEKLGTIENNVAVPGAGYVNEGAGGNSKFSNQVMLLDADCTTVFMCGGINDAPMGQTDAQIAAAVMNAVNGVAARCPDALLVVISPLWNASAPSADLLKVERQIRAAVPANIPFIEGGPWMRVGRVEWQIWDGHPNALGACAISAWVSDQLGYPTRGAIYNAIVTPGTADLPLTTGNFPGWVLGKDTIWSAKPGFWRLEAQLVMYNAAVNGYIWLMETNRKIKLRSDQSNALPQVHRISTEFYHPGGDLPVKFGYDPSNSGMVVLTNLNTCMSARWIG